MRYLKSRIESANDSSSTRLSSLQAAPPAPPLRGAACIVIKPLAYIRGVFIVCILHSSKSYKRRKVTIAMLVVVIPPVFHTIFGSTIIITFSLLRPAGESFE